MSEKVITWTRGSVPEILATLALAGTVVSTTMTLGHQEEVAKHHVQQEYLEETMILIPEEAIVEESARVQDLSAGYTAILTGLLLTGVTILVLTALSRWRDRFLTATICAAGFGFLGQFSLLYLHLERVPAIIELVAAALWGVLSILLLRRRMRRHVTKRNTFGLRASRFGYISEPRERN